MPENAPVPMFVTLLGIKMLDILVPENAEAPMVITVGGIVMEANGHWANARSPITNKLLGKITEVRLEQPLKASLLILETLLAIVTDERLVQFSNVLSSIDVTREGIFILLRLVQ